MFSSSGYFRGVNCPYYLNGLCERPYCHFRHVKQDKESAPSLSRSVSREASDTSSISSYGGPSCSQSEAILSAEPKVKVQKDIVISDDESDDDQPSEKDQKEDNEKENVKDCKIGPYGKYWPTQQYEPIEIGVANGNGGDSKSKYTPTPIHTLESKAKSPEKKALPKAKGGAMLQYNPTPIVQLKQMRKMPRYAANLGKTSQETEYDPLYNFSTLGKENTDKRIRHKRSRSQDLQLEEYVPSKKNHLEVDGEFSSEEEAEYEPVPVQGGPKYIPSSGNSKYPIDQHPDDFSDDDDDEMENGHDDLNSAEDTKDTENGTANSSVKDESKLSMDDYLKLLLNPSLPAHPAVTRPYELKQKTKELKSNNARNKCVKQEKADKVKNAKIEKNTDVTSVTSSSSNATVQQDDSKKSAKNQERSLADFISKNIVPDDDGHTKSATPKESSGKKSLVSSHSSSGNHNGSSISLRDKHNMKEKKLCDGEKSKSSKDGCHKLDKQHSKDGQHSSGKHSHISSSQKADKDKHEKDRKHSTTGISSSNHSNSAKKSTSHDHHRRKSSSSHSSPSNSLSSKSSTKSIKPDSKSSGSCKSSSHIGVSPSSSRSKHGSGSSRRSSSEKFGSKSDIEKRRHSSKDETSTSHRHSEPKSSHAISKTSSKHINGTDKEQKIIVVDKKKILNVNVDLFGMDSDVSDDNSVQMSHDLGEDRDSDETFRGDNLDSDVEMSLDISDLEDDADTYEECLRIFKETGNYVKLPDKGKTVTKAATEEDYPSTGKKRMARKVDAQAIAKKIAERPYSKLSPAQVMHNRFIHMQKRALEAAAANKSIQEPSTSGMSAKSRTSRTSSLSSRKQEKLVISTASKMDKRVAHAPIIATLPRPTVPADFGSKIPTNVRQRYLNLIIDECLKICKTEKEAYNRGLEEEAAAYARAGNKNIYLNVSVNVIKKLRVEVANKNNTSLAKANPNMTLSHETMLGGWKATQISYTLNRSGGGACRGPVEDFTGAELFKRLRTYHLTEEQLVDNGFPRWDTDRPGVPSIVNMHRQESPQKRTVAKENERQCIRCGKRFEVYPNGKYAVQEECVYHWGKAWKRRIAGSLDTRYTCCSGELEVNGCQVCKYHVHENNKRENLSGFMRTLPCSPPIDGDYGVYAMDCEMVYTFGGMELARVTVIGPDLSSAYESIVKPDKRVIDYNTRFSGLTEEDMKGVKTTLRDVQAILLSLFSEKTLLIGHSLESDFVATKLIHSTVVDTSVVFPHRLGPPYKRALKTLMAEYLQKIIQDDVGGHDSHEDAASCMELMQWKLKEEAKKERKW